MIILYIYRATVGRNLDKIPSGGEVTPFGDVTLAYAHVKMHNRFVFLMYYCVKLRISVKEPCHSSQEMHLQV